MPDIQIEGRELGDNPYAAPHKPRGRRRVKLFANDHLAEKDFQSQVIALAKGEGWLTYHVYDSRRSEAGFPDLVLAHPERGVIFAELKTDSGNTTDAQDLWFFTLESGGAEVYVWRPAQLASGYIREILTSSRPE